MSNRKKGHSRSKHLRHRSQDKRGGNTAADFPTGAPGTLISINLKLGRVLCYDNSL
jgi:hypothetical protein